MKWAKRHTRVEQIDVGATMWDFHRTFMPSELPNGETVLAFTLTDIERHNRWWFVISDREVDICDSDPGKSVDLYVRAPIELLIDVWIGERELEAALRQEEIILAVEPLLADTVIHWFPMSPVARAKKAEEAAL